MKKLISILSVFLTVSVTTAQVWCPPGATWNYRLKTGIGQGQNNYDGFLDVSPTGTTVIAGKTCTTISGVWTGTWNWPASMPMNWSQSIDTYFQNNVVYYYEYTKGKFDTLMDYNAVPGTSWYVSGWDSSCIQLFPAKPYKYVVTDTGHVNVNGISLKSYTITQSANTTWKYQLIERIGNTTIFFHDIYTCFLDGGDFRGVFSCYRDNQLGIYSKNSDCNFVSIEEQEDNSPVLNIFPNPSHGLYHFSLISATTIEIYNMEGSLVYRKPFEPGERQFDISTLGDGLYLLKTNMGQTQKIFKNQE